MQPYETKQAVLEEAGLSHRVEAEVPSGEVDGTNKVFTLANLRVSDTNYDDEVTLADLHAFVDGVEVVIQRLDRRTSTITLAAAPGAATEFTVDYRYQSIDEGLLERIIEEAQAVVDEAMVDIDPVPYAEAPATVRKIVRFYAAGMLLIKDYGFNEDNEGTSKDGAKKVAMAEKWLDKYAGTGGATGFVQTSAATDSEVLSDGAFFGVDPARPSIDDAFYRDFF